MASRRVPLVTFVFLTLFAIPCLQAADQNDEEAIKAFVQTWVEVNRKQDVEGLMALVAPDARLDSRSARAKVSKGTWTASIKQAVASGTFGRNQEARIISVTFPAPDRAVLELETSWSIVGGRRPGTQTEKERWTLAKRDGRWFIIEKDYL